MMYRAVIFDVGGVMHSSVHQGSRQDVLDTLIGDNILTSEEAKILYQEGLNQLAIGGIDEAAFWQRATDKTRLPLPDGYEEAWRKRLRDEAMVYPEMYGLVEELKRNGIKTYVSSNTIAPHAEVLRAQHIYEPFDDVFLSQEIKLKKPDPAAYQYVIEKIGFDPKEVIFIDDLEENLVPANALGITTVLAQNPAQVIADVHKLLGLQ